MPDPDLLRKLSRALALAKHSPLYEHLDLRLPLSGLAAFERLPFTDKSVLRASAPFGALGCPIDEVVEVHTSSATTGRAVPGFLTKRDQSRGAAAIAEAWANFGVDSKSRVAFAMTYGMFSGAAINTAALHHLGALVIPCGVLPPAKLLALVEEYEANFLVGTPSQLLHVTRFLKGTDRRTPPCLKTVIAAGEVYDETTRARIERGLAVRVFDHYGLCEVNTGIAYECEYRTGMHLVSDYVFAEVVEPGQTQSAPQGREGELVLTTLDKEASPLVRYRTGDKACLFASACPCGRTGQRISRISGRVDDLVFFRGLKFDARYLKERVQQVFGRQLVPEMTFRVEQSGAVRPVLFVTPRREQRKLKLERISSFLHEESSIRIDVHIAPNPSFDKSPPLKAPLVQRFSIHD